MERLSHMNTFQINTDEIDIFLISLAKQIHSLPEMCRGSL